MIETFNNDRDIQLKIYSDFIKPVKRKSIDVDMEIESLFENLVIHSDSYIYHKKNIYHDSRINMFCFEYDYQLEGLMSLGCSKRIRLMFENMGITEKKSFRYITRMMNRHQNISKVNRIYYFKNF